MDTFPSTGIEELKLRSPKLYPSSVLYLLVLSLVEITVFVYQHGHLPLSVYANIFILAGTNILCSAASVNSVHTWNNKFGLFSKQLLSESLLG